MKEGGSMKRYRRGKFGPLMHFNRDTPYNCRDPFLFDMSCRKKNDHKMGGRSQLRKDASNLKRQDEN